METERNELRRVPRSFNIPNVLEYAKSNESNDLFEEIRRKEDELHEEIDKLEETEEEVEGKSIFNWEKLHKAGKIWEDTHLNRGPYSHITFFFMMKKTMNIYFLKKKKKKLENMKK